MSFYKSLFELSKSVKMQNLFQAAKDLHHIRLFENETDLSNIQSLFLSYLYTINDVNKDIIIDKISPKVLDNELFLDSYLLYKKENRKKEDQKDKKRDLSLVAGKQIKFKNKRGK